MHKMYLKSGKTLSITTTFMNEVNESTDNKFSESYTKTKFVNPQQRRDFKQDVVIVRAKMKWNGKHIQQSIDAVTEETGVNQQLRNRGGYSLKQVKNMFK